MILLRARKRLVSIVWLLEGKRLTTHLNINNRYVSDDIIVVVNNSQG